MGRAVDRPAVGNLAVVRGRSRRWSRQRPRRSWLCWEGLASAGLEGSEGDPAPVYEFVAKSHTGDPDAAPYREFRDRLVEAFAKNAARTGIEDRGIIANACPQLIALRSETGTRIVVY